MLGFEDKVILVTGGSRGIGATTVGLLEELGAKVAYNDRAGLEQRGSLALQFDVTDAKGMEEVVHRTENELGPIYGVVANAGITQDNFFPNLLPEQWDAVINVNLTGVFNTIK